MELPVVVVMSKCGLMTIERMKAAKPSQGILSAQGVCEICTNISFRILVTKDLKNPVVLHKHLCIYLDSGLQECIVEREGKA